MAGKKRELVASVDGSLIDAAEAVIRDKKAVAKARLPSWKLLSPAAQKELVDALVGRGLEVGDKGALRVPLREQVQSLVQGGARLPLAAAKKRLAGAAAKDKDLALADACKAAALHLVVRTRVETLVGGRGGIL